MKFKKEDLLDDVFEVIEDEILFTTRWSVHYRKVFRCDDKFYETVYSRGSTECQDERPYQDEGPEIECPEVRPVQKIITIYELVTPD